MFPFALHGLRFFGYYCFFVATVTVVLELERTAEVLAMVLRDVASAIHVIHI